MYDWFNVRSGNNHEHKVIIDDENSFVRRLHFYGSRRVGGNGITKDAVAESYMKMSEAKHANHSEGLARLKSITMMKDAGIRGQSNGRNKNGTKLHYAIKLEHTHREFRYDYDKIYTMDDILLTEPERGKTWDLTKRLFRHKQITTLQESFRLPANL